MIDKSTLGRLFFAAAAMASGIQQLFTAHFVRLVPPLPAWIPWPTFWAYLIGIVLIVIGVAIGTGRRARLAAAALGGMIFLMFMFLNLPRALTKPLVGFMWTNPCKALALGGGAFFLAAVLPEAGGRFSAVDRLVGKLKFLGPLFLGVFLLVCGAQHFVYADFVAQLVPAWIPGLQFWTYFTGVALIAGGAGILVPKTTRLAATWSGIMVFLWVVLLHIPRAITMQDAGETAAIFEALAVSGIAFVLAGNLPEKER
jgi:uncharacterized membrane protein